MCAHRVMTIVLSGYKEGAGVQREENIVVTAVQYICDIRGSAS